MGNKAWRNAPYQNRACSLPQAARGPVILIVIGVLFALDQMGISFGRTWPAILIAIGVMKLMERMSPSQAPPPPYAQPQYPPPPGATPPWGTYPPPPPPPPPTPDPFADPGRRRQ